MPSSHFNHYNKLLQHYASKNRKAMTKAEASLLKHVLYKIQILDNPIYI
jgi:hypothetical protein